MPSEGSRFTWGLEVRLYSPKVVFATATVGNHLRVRRKALHSDECCRKVSRKCVQLTHVAAVILVFAEEVSVRVICGAASILTFYVCRGVSESNPPLYWRLQRGYRSEWPVSPQLYWSLQRRCQCEWPVSPQVYWCLERKHLCEWFVVPQLFWCLQRKWECEWSVSPQL